MDPIVAERINGFVAAGDEQGLTAYALSLCESPALSRARVVKLLYEVLDYLGADPARLALELAVCRALVAFARSKNRTALRQRLEQKLAELSFAAGEYRAASQLAGSLVAEAKRLDDRLLAVELQLLEAKINYRVRNFSKAKGAITGARVDANAIYVPPKLQGELDMMSGSLNGEDRDYLTAASYFYEAFSTYHGMGDRARATYALKCLLLMKLLNHKAGEIEAVLNGKDTVGYSQERDVLCIKEVSRAFERRSIELYRQVATAYAAELASDEFVRTHLARLYEALVEENIVRVLEPYSAVEVERVAALVGIDPAAAEKKLSTMILEEKVRGVIDQNRGVLVLFEEAPEDSILARGIELTRELNRTVDSLDEMALRVLQETTFAAEP